MVHRFAAVPMGLGLLVSYAFGADEKPPARPPAPRAQAARPQQNKPAAPRQGQAQQQKAPAPDRLTNELLKMTPEEREKALKNIPEPQREKILNRLNALGKIPPSQQNRQLQRAAKLNSLPPQRQNQIRRSSRLFLQLPEERQQQIGAELRKMAPLPDDERRAYMNTEEFRNRYSPNEQQIISNLAEIEP